MTRLYGRASGGGRVRCHAPHGHWCTTTLISSIRLDGTTAAMELPGALDAPAFREYVRQILVPTLRPGDVVVLDNLSVHRDAQAAEWIVRAGASVQFLPPYSPDFNPIEKMGSKIKTFLRAASARTSEALSEAIANAFRTITPQDAQGWFKACSIEVIQ